MGIAHGKASPGFFWSWESGPEISRKELPKAQEEDLTSPEAPSHLELHARTISLPHFTAECWWQIEGEGTNPSVLEPLRGTQGSASAGESLWRSTQKICHPKSQIQLLLPIGQQAEEELFAGAPSQL